MNILYDNNQYESVVSRMYYAIYHIMNCILDSKKKIKNPDNHTATLEILENLNIFSKDVIKDIEDCRNLRIQADYSIDKIRTIRDDVDFIKKFIEKYKKTYQTLEIHVIKWFKQVGYKIY